jgi:protein fantom
LQKVYQRKLVNFEAQLAETIGELDKSRHLLITQVKINDDYKKEVYLIQNKMEENKAEYDTKMLEYAQLLDLRAARIKVFLSNMIHVKRCLTISKFHI